MSRGTESEPGGAAVRPSTVKLPERPPAGVATIFEFFLRRFPRVSRATWQERFVAGGVWCATGAVGVDTPYRPLLELHYRRHVEHEPPVRTDVVTVWSDDQLLVVDKPPHLPVTPGGLWVRNCLLHHLLETTGETGLAPLHRIDRLSSGLVVLSRDPATRPHFGRLFQTPGAVEKVYTAVSERRAALPGERFELHHHVRRSDSEYWRQVVDPERPPNALSVVRVLGEAEGLVLLELRPTTGRKHQIRVQLAHAGLPILGDPLYGSVRSNEPGDLGRWLWLDAHRLVVGGFPRPDGGEPLVAEWQSSRPPHELLRRAAEECRRRG